MEANHINADVCERITHAVECTLAGRRTGQA
jgi:hypothetical protein